MPPEINIEALNILIAYGFTHECSKKALLATEGQSIDKALDWIYEHLDDEA